MSPTLKEAKLAELRAKTDADLIRYVTNELTAGIRFASTPDEMSRVRAEEVHSEIERLLPVVNGLGDGERRRLTAKFERLGEMLNRTPVLAEATC